MVGVSVGLGNVWRFPYMMGEYGGSAFLFIYLLFTLFFAVPAVMAEWGLGRSTRQGPIGAFSALLGKPAGLAIGTVLIITILVAESYYIYVIANVAYSSSFSMAFGFEEANIEIYQKYLNDPFAQYLICFVLLVLSYTVLVRGLKSGIESISKIFVPFFVVIMSMLIAYAIQLDGAAEKVVEYLYPDFSALKPVHIFAALGQAFYSLGLGGTFLLVFGSFMREEDNLGKTASFTALGDVSAALMAGLFIVPTVLALGLNMSEGPGLLFSTLPQLFQRLPLGQLFGSMFLLALFAVTFISSLAAIEVILTGISDVVKERIKRKTLILIICIVEAIVIIPIAIDPSIISILDLIFGSGLQLLGCMMALIALTWGQSRKQALSAVFGDTKRTWHIAYFYWVKWVVPATLFTVFIGYVLSKI